MSLSNSASHIARRAQSEAAPWVRRLARAGYAAKGVVYILVGFLAAASAVGARGESEGTKGALASVVGAPFGQAILVLIGLGLMGYVVWQFVRAGLDPEGAGSDAKGITRRAGYAISGAVYTALAVEAARLAQGAGGSGGENAAAHWTGRALEVPFGQIAVALVGLGIAVYGVYQGVKAVRSDICKRLDLPSLDAQQRDTVEWAGRAGLAARGVVFVVTGAFVVVAAWKAQAAEARGLDGVLQTLERQPAGPALLALVAVGLVGYGAFQVVQARYRVIRTS